MMLMDISFLCECGEQIEETIDVPMPNFTAEKNKDSGVENFDQICCKSCNTQHEVYVVNTFDRADCSVNYGGTDVNYDMPYFSESDEDELAWLIQNETQIDIFQNHIKSVEKILEADIDEEAYFSLLVMLYGHVVAAVEAYLSSTFIQKVTNSEELTRKLIETDPSFSKTKFTLKEIFEEQEKLKLTVATYLENLIFHDLKKVKPMYRDVLNCEFGDIGWLFKAVAIRHHCVHRAGYDKENIRVKLSVDILKELVVKAKGLTSLIENKVSPVTMLETEIPPF
ncbi:hypothetical protein ACQKC9_13175 [Psychrobacter sp. NPDC078409]|uniref:hypothetical protein n=1 Tax=Psychrobacter sp. NPDC078409 TaxID=3390660 RepID=UPI003D07DDBA